MESPVRLDVEVEVEMVFPLRSVAEPLEAVLRHG